jgi:hypothetical protein
MKINCKCFLLGHKISEHTDGGYHYCTRCHAHEYWDEYYQTVDEEFNKWQFTLKTFRKWIWFYVSLYWKMIRSHLFDRCSDCGKIRRILWWKTKHKHHSCLPF